MASFEDTVQAKNPALFLRLDKTGIDSDGDSWPDISANTLNGIQIYTGATAPARGHASGVETDGASRAFEAWVNAGIESLAGESRIRVPNDSALDAPGDFTLIHVFRPLANIPFAGDFPMAQKQGSFGTLLTWSGGTRLGGYCKDNAGGTFFVRDPTLLVTDFLGTWFFLAVRRIANLLELYVNDQLRAQTVIGSGLPTAVSSGDFNVGAPGPFYTHNQHDEAIVVTEALSADALLEIYESMLNNPPINCRADLRLVATLDGTDDPTPQLFPFSHNWETEVREDLSWLTDVIPSAQDYEQTAGIRQRPLRSLEYDYALLDNAERRRLHAYLFQNQRRTVYARIETDVVQLTANAPAGSGSLPFVSTHYDFDDGTLAALLDPNDQYNFEIVELDTVGASSSSLAGVTVATWPKGTPVVPVRRAVMESQLDYRRHTDAMEDFSVTFRILAEDVALTPRRNGTYTPRYTYKGFEVFDPFVLGTNNFRDEGRGKVQLRAVDVDSPAGIFNRDPQDTASREIVSYSFFLDTRADIARFLAWKWSIQGRRVLLWVPTLQPDFTPLATGLGPVTLTVAGHEYTDFYQSHGARRDLILVYNDDTMAAKRISSAVTSGANDVLTIEGFDEISLANLRCASFLKLSRLNEDTIGLVWHDTDLLEVTLNFLDLLTTP